MIKFLVERGSARLFVMNTEDFGTIGGVKHFRVFSLEQRFNDTTPRLYYHTVQADVLNNGFKAITEEEAYQRSQRFYVRVMLIWRVEPQAESLIARVPRKKSDDDDQGDRVA